MRRWQPLERAWQERAGSDGQPERGPLEAEACRLSRLGKGRLNEGEGGT